MTQIEQNEQVLTAFLDEVSREELAGWNRPRNTEELASFVARRLAIVEDIA